MSDDRLTQDEVSRREVIKKAIKIGGAAYVAPVVLTALTPVSALAAVTGPTPVPPTPTPGAVPTPTGPVLPCSGARVESGGQGVTSNNHDVGRTSGVFTFTWDAYAIPDKFEVFYQGAVIFTTGGEVSGPGSRSISFSGSSSVVTVVVTGPSSGTAWEYTINCATAA